MDFVLDDDTRRELRLKALDQMNRNLAETINMILFEVGTPCSLADVCSIFNNVSRDVIVERIKFLYENNIIIVYEIDNDE